MLCSKCKIEMPIVVMFQGKCDDILCEKCFIFHDECDVCKNAGYGFNTRMGIVQMSKCYRLHVNSIVDKYVEHRNSKDSGEVNK